MARLKGFEKLTDVDEARSAFMEALKPTRISAVQVALSAAFGRILAENVTAEGDLPPFDRSAVDGYAVRAPDAFEASQFNPKVLKLTQENAVGPKEARQIWTGNPLPPEADAVVMLEHTRRIGEGIEVWAPLPPGENVSKRGEDVKRGEVALKAATRLRAHHMALLAALGKTHVEVVKKPLVAIFSTGNELVKPGREPEPHQVIDVNRLALSFMCLELGAETLDLGIARDDAEEIGAKIGEGLGKADAVIVTGGTSVGYADLVPTVVGRMGKPGVIVHGIAMRPGMPTALAVLQGKPIFILSGNPVAAMVGFEVFARPLILKLLGIESEPRPMVKARLTQRVASTLGRRVFLRVKVFEKDGDFFAEPIRVRGSGILTTMTKANGYVIIPENREGLDQGETVTVHLFDKIGGVGIV